jgi:ABC-type multidrug transport system fused ATPase/permease subunit
MKVPRSLPFLIKYISPAFLLTIFVLWCWQKFPEQLAKMQSNTVTQITVLFLLAALLLFLGMTYFAVARWQHREERRHHP